MNAYSPSYLRDRHKLLRDDAREAVDG